MPRFHLVARWKNGQQDGNKSKSEKDTAHIMQLVTHKHVHIHMYVHILHACTFVSPYIKGPPGTIYCIKAQLAGYYLSARPLTWESYDRYTVAKKTLTVARKW